MPIILPNPQNICPTRALCSLLAIVCVACQALLPSASWAQNPDQDLKSYMDLMISLTDLELPAQYQTVLDFLSDHPEHVYAEEIEANLQQMQALLSASDGKQNQRRKDAELYLKASKYAERLGPLEQITLWKQFMEENPKSSYLAEAAIRLSRLEKEFPSQTNSENASTTRGKESISEDAQVAAPLPPRDPKKATFLATLPGLLVPALGHWYTKDTTQAVVITAVRGAGYIVGIQGLIAQNYFTIWTGVAISIFGYLADVIDAPYSAKRYNKKHAKRLSQGFKTKVLDENWPSEVSQARQNFEPWASIGWTF